MLAVARAAKAAVAGALMLMAAAPAAATGMAVEPKADSPAPGAVATTTTDICQAGGQATDVGYYTDVRRGSGSARLNPALCTTARALADSRVATPFVNAYEERRGEVERSANRATETPQVTTPTVDVHLDPRLDLPTLRPPSAPQLDLEPPELPAPLEPGPAARPPDVAAAGAGPDPDARLSEPAALQPWTASLLPPAPGREGTPSVDSRPPGASAPPASFEPMAAHPHAPRPVLGGLAETTLVRHAVVSAALGLLAWGALGLYHRLAASQQLDHPARRALYEAVRQVPGARLADLARATGLHPKTVRYHATTLVTSKVLARDAAGGYRLPGAPAGTPLDERLLRVVREQPGVNVAELARRVGVSKACAQSHVTGLLLAGAVIGRREQGARRLFPA